MGTEFPELRPYDPANSVPNAVPMPPAYGVSQLSRCSATKASSISHG